MSDTPRHAPLHSVCFWRSPPECHPLGKINSPAKSVINGPIGEYISFLRIVWSFYPFHIGRLNSTGVEISPPGSGPLTGKVLAMWRWCGPPWNVLTVDGVKVVSLAWLVLARHPDGAISGAPQGPWKVGVRWNTVTPFPWHFGVKKPTWLKKPHLFLGHLYRGYL